MPPRSNNNNNNEHLAAGPSCPESRTSQESRTWEGGSQRSKVIIAGGGGLSLPDLIPTWLHLRFFGCCLCFCDYFSCIESSIFNVMIDSLFILIVLWTDILSFKHSMFCIVFFRQVGLFAIISNQLYCHNCICQTGGIICNYFMLCIVRIAIIKQRDEIDSIVAPYSQQVAMLSGTNLSNSYSKHIHFSVWRELLPNWVSLKNNFLDFIENLFRQIAPPSLSCTFPKQGY